VGAGLGAGLGAGAGLAAVLASGLPVGTAVATAGAGGLLGLIAGARRRRAARPARRSPVDPFAVGEPWRHDVRRALQARDRYRAAVRDVAPGPLRERLEAIGERVEDGVEACWRTARRGWELERAHGGTSAADLAARAGELEGRAAAGPADDPSLAEAAAAARRQHESLTRIDAAADDARRRLTVLAARLDEAATRAVELAVRADPASGTDPVAAGLGHDVDAVVDELEAVRRALDEV
jgi:hypothetical protein